MCMVYGLYALCSYALPMCLYVLGCAVYGSGVYAVQPFHFNYLQTERQWLWMLNREQGLWFNLLPEYHSAKWYVLVHLTEGSSWFGVVNSFLWWFTVSSRRIAVVVVGFFSFFLVSLSAVLNIKCFKWSFWKSIWQKWDVFFTGTEMVGVAEPDSNVFKLNGF